MSDKDILAPGKVSAPFFLIVLVAIIALLYWTRSKLGLAEDGVKVEDWTPPEPDDPLEPLKDDYIPIKTPMEPPLMKSTRKSTVEPSPNTTSVKSAETITPIINKPISPYQRVLTPTPAPVTAPTLIDNTSDSYERWKTRSMPLSPTTTIGAGAGTGGGGAGVRRETTVYPMRGSGGGVR